LTLLDLWKRWPGPLIGFVTGQISGVWVLSVGPEAAEWWEANYHRLLPTRAYENRSGGVDLYFTRGDGIPTTTARICADVDTRSDGGFVVHWFAAGLTCRDHSPLASWPNWLRNALTAIA
jgi:hypothetical protein